VDEFVILYAKSGPARARVNSESIALYYSVGYDGSGKKRQGGMEYSSYHFERIFPNMRIGTTMWRRTDYHFNQR
jgi:hypothetical protein